jgi:hypothetical protein
MARSLLAAALIPALAAAFVSHSRPLPRAAAPSRVLPKVSAELTMRTPLMAGNWKVRGEGAAPRGDTHTQSMRRSRSGAFAGSEKETRERERRGVSVDGVPGGEEGEGEETTLRSTAPSPPPLSVAD